MRLFGGLERRLAKYFLPVLLTTAIGCSGQSPVVPKENKVEYSDYQEAKTDENGIASFVKKDGSNLELIVEDKQGSIIPNANTSYRNLDYSEVFTVNYDNRANILFENHHNLEENYNIKSSAFNYKIILPMIGEYLIQNFTDEIKAVKDYLYIYILNESLCENNEFGYVGTIKGEDLINFYSAAVGISLFIAGGEGDEVAKVISNLDEK